MAATVYFHTLGCKLNYSETVTFARQFETYGVVQAESEEVATILVVNSCAVTEQAQRKCRQYIRKVRRLNPAVYIVLVGCYANLSSYELREKEKIDLVITGAEKAQLAQRTLSAMGLTPKTSCESLDDPHSFFHAYTDTGRTRAFLKVQDGCNYHCTYCTIPLARGESRSPRIETLVQAAEAIASKGGREIVLTGVNTGDFGRTHRERFIELLRALEQVRGIERYRISSIEPNLLTDEILEFLSTSRAFLPHLHVPLQSGADSVLKRMGRRYTTAIFLDRIEAARHYLADPFIGVDVIVAFPGESEQDYQQTYSFLEEVAPAFLHVFPYSRRPGTPAATMPQQVHGREAHSRVNRLMKLSDELHASYAQRFAHTVRPVLIEQETRDGWAVGFTDNYIRVEFPIRGHRLGEIVPVRLGAQFTDGVMLGDVTNGMVADGKRENSKDTGASTPIGA